MAKRRRKKQTNYAARRIVLALMVLALLGGGAWLVSGWIKGMYPEESAPESSQEAPPESEPESEPEPEPESQPEEEPTAPHEDDTWRLILASAATPLPEGYAPPALEAVADGYQVDARCAEDLTQMIAAARMEGVSLMICSAYRSESRQRELHEQKTDEYKAFGYGDEAAVAAASTIVLPPGTSEHQTGLAVDIVTLEYQVLDDGYAETLAAKWLAANAWKYGFVLRYPQDKEDITKVIFEPWHYRYVGHEHAQAIYEGGYCLEEYLYGVLGRYNLESSSPETSPPQDAIPVDGEISEEQ